MVNGKWLPIFRALESVSIASALSTALTIYPCQIRVHQRWQSKLQLPTARKEWQPATADSSPVNTVIHTTLLGLEPATLRSLVDCWSDALPVVPPTHQMSLARVVFEILRSKRIGVTSDSRVWAFKVTWCHRSRDHSIAHMPFPGFWWSFGTNNQASVTVSEIFNECYAMVDVTLVRPLNKGQGHSFWYQSIFHIRLPIGCLPTVTFALGRTV